jgi:hypothetical protein
MIKIQYYIISILPFSKIYIKKTDILSRSYYFDDTVFLYLIIHINQQVIIYFNFIQKTKTQSGPNLGCMFLIQKVQ